ncbi:hypothetical protein AGRA3207_004463 [Actinomadura graeca]|uniref:Peptidase inhibitor family I36 n=1 Tax=Actinomadura graeca TaxID=2750812 RepID=A0ABX8R0T8_9ACTN|nr:hypothetical protein [Actinomadura graeca]QXJ23322.1 hypothetical protein AGRA3207_004463 [Actinomadura graeca]
MSTETKPGRRRLRRSVTAAFGIGAIAALVLPAPAQAATGASAANTTRAGSALLGHQDGVCTGGEFCLYQNILATQSFSDFAVNDPNLFDNVYLSPGTGQGTVVANNSRFGRNNDATRSAVICTDVNYTGSCAGFVPNSGGAFNVTYRGNVESLYFS